MNSSSINNNKQHSMMLKIPYLVANNGGSNESTPCASPVTGDDNCFSFSGAEEFLKLDDIDKIMNGKLLSFSNLIHSDIPAAFASSLISSTNNASNGGTKQVKEEEADLIDLELMNFVAFCDDTLSDCGGSPTPANSDAEEGPDHEDAKGTPYNFGLSIKKDDEDNKSVDTEDEHDDAGIIIPTTQSVALPPPLPITKVVVETKLPESQVTTTKTVAPNTKKHRLSDSGDDLNLSISEGDDQSYEGDDESRKANRILKAQSASRSQSTNNTSVQRKKKLCSTQPSAVPTLAQKAKGPACSFLPATGTAGKLKCGTCNACFSSIGFLRTHQASHQPRTHFQCQAPGCEKSYQTAEGLRLHIRNHHEIDKRWVCLAPGCERKFVRQSDLRMHIVRMHSGVRPFPCGEVGCGKAFACNSELRRHIIMSHKDKRDVLLEKAQAHVKNGSETVAIILKDLACMENTPKKEKRGNGRSTPLW